MQLEILHGPEMYFPENYTCIEPGCLAHGRGAAAPAPSEPKAPTKASAAKPAAAEPVPEIRGGFSEVYSNKHEKLLLRVEHIERMDAIRKAYNKGRLHGAQAPMTTSDFVNAALDFVFEHRIAFSTLKSAGDLPAFLTEQIYRDMLSRWRQWTESF